jgi:rhamnose transport system permease protein
VNTDNTKSTTFKWYQFREIGISMTAVVVFIIVAVIEPRFLMYGNLRSVMLYIPLIVVVAMGEMMVIVTRNIDLSVGSILGFSGMTVGLLFIRIPGFPIVIAFLLGTFIGAGLGAVNGFLITRLKLPSIIVTLGTLSMYRGFLFIISGGRQIDPNYIPAKLIRLSQVSPIVIPWIVLFAVIIAVITAVFIKYSHIGREIYAIGSNPSAAMLRGIKVDGVLILIFSISGACAGFAGIMYASRFGYVNPGMTGVGFEFTVIAATIIGGTSVAGGSGSVLGTVIGCILLGIVNTALAVLGVSAFWQKSMYGIIIISALIIDKSIQNKVMKTLRKESTR